MGCTCKYGYSPETNLWRKDLSMQMGAGVPALNPTNTENALSQECQERSKLAEQYDATIEAYTESVKAMMEVHGMESRNAFQRVLEARNACENLRTALVDHERFHNCAREPLASM